MTAHQLTDMTVGRRMAQLPLRLRAKRAYVKIPALVIVDDDHHAVTSVSASSVDHIDHMDCAFHNLL